MVSCDAALTLLSLSRLSVPVSHYQEHIVSGNRIQSFRLLIAKGLLCLDVFSVVGWSADMYYSSLYVSGVESS